VVKAGAIRQKWLDQAQSLNIFVTSDISGRELADIYITGWELGLKTTYYLRSQAAEVSAPVCKILDNGCTSCQ
jgi:ribonucleoside-diphosphate reductase alpha chain